MPVFYSESKLRDTAQRAVGTAYLSSEKAINEMQAYGARLAKPGMYDAFLSYSSMDWVIIYGLYRELLSKGLTIYVDRIEDPQLDRAQVTVATAALLRHRMRSCRSLLFATTENLSKSKWLPWEVGFHDGFSGKVAIIPVTNQTTFTGQEYLGLYPYMESDGWIWSTEHKPVSVVTSWVKS